MMPDPERVRDRLQYSTARAAADGRACDQLFEEEFGAAGKMMVAQFKTTLAGVEGPEATTLSEATANWPIAPPRSRRKDVVRSATSPQTHARVTWTLASNAIIGSNSAR